MTGRPCKGGEDGQPLRTRQNYHIDPPEDLKNCLTGWWLPRNSRNRTMQLQRQTLDTTAAYPCGLHVGNTTLPNVDEGLTNRPLP